MKDNKDRNEVLAAVKEDGNALEYADESLKKDKEIVMAAVKQDGWALEYADESLKKDKEIVMAAVTQDEWCTPLFFADTSLKKDKEIVMVAVKTSGSKSLKNADDSLLKDKEIFMAAFKQDGFALDYADESLKKNKEIVMAAVKQDGWALEYADESLKKNKEIVMAAVKEDGNALEYADESLKKDKEIVMAAVKQDGYALRFADESLKKNKEIVMAAVKEDSLALDFADESLQKDKEFADFMSKNPHLMFKIPDIDSNEVLAIISGENLCVNEFTIDEKDINTTEKIKDFFSDPEDLGFRFTKGLGLEVYDCPIERLMLGTLSDNNENKLSSVDVEIQLDSDHELDIDITNVKNIGQDEFPQLPATPIKGQILLTYYFIAQDAIYELKIFKKDAETGENIKICIEVEPSWMGAVANNTETAEFEFTLQSTGASYDHMVIISFDDGKCIECDSEHEEIIKSISEYLISKRVFN